tara:strand:+ start:110 stop:475 length:366 start_codon:yes stop_codon:yes gene_type:complete
MREIKGIEFPFQKGIESFPKGAKGIGAILARVRSLLTTSKGEVPMMPNQGSIVQKYVFERMTPLMKTYLANEIKTQINSYVPQMKVVDVQSVVEDNRVNVIIGYILDGVAGELKVDFGLLS